MSDSAQSLSNGPRKLSKFGWCWERQQFLGETCHLGLGAKWFGLERVCCMYPFNKEVAQQLVGFQEVVYEISSWQSESRGGLEIRDLTGDLRQRRKNTALVRELAGDKSNVRGGFDVDLLTINRREGIKPEDYSLIYESLKKDSPHLKLWAILHTHELDKKYYSGFESFMDVIHLWEWDSDKLKELPSHVDYCRQAFPGKPIIIGCFLRDFLSRTGISLDALKFQWKYLLKMVDEGVVDGYSIFGGFLIDIHPEQASWIRSFIAAH